MFKHCASEIALVGAVSMDMIESGAHSRRDGVDIPLMIELGSFDGERRKHYDIRLGNSVVNFSDGRDVNHEVPPSPELT